MSNTSERISDLSYAAGWRGVRAMPEKFAVRTFDRGADFAARRNGGPLQLRKNLARVIGVEGPEQVPDYLVRASMRSYARYWREAFRLPSMDLTVLAKELDSMVQGKENITAAMDRGKGLILALPHSGNWDMAGVWLAQTWGRFSTVAERLKPESLYQRFVDYRETLGFEIFPTSGGEAPPFAALSDRLRDGKIICLLGDRDLTVKGVPVTFFGERTRFPAGPARLAIETGATLLPVHTWFTAAGWGFKAGSPIDTSVGMEAATQTLATQFEGNIARHPADWHMLQPLWWDDLSQSRRARLGQP